MEAEGKWEASRCAPMIVPHPYSKTVMSKELLSLTVSAIHSPTTIIVNAVRHAENRIVAAVMVFELSQATFLMPQVIFWQANDFTTGGHTIVTELVVALGIERLKGIIIGMLVDL